MNKDMILVSRYESVLKSKIYFVGIYKSLKGKYMENGEEHDRLHISMDTNVEHGHTISIDLARMPDEAKQYFSKEWGIYFPDMANTDDA